MAIKILLVVPGALVAGWLLLIATLCVCFAWVDRRDRRDLKRELQARRRREEVSDRRIVRGD